jgi:hypothetical protein
VFEVGTLWCIKLSELLSYQPDSSDTVRFYSDVHARITLLPPLQLDNPCLFEPWATSDADAATAAAAAAAAAVSPQVPPHGGSSC